MELGQISLTGTDSGRAETRGPVAAKARPPRVLGWLLAGLLSSGLWLGLFGLLRVLG
ncbi:MAG: hypothetical protein JWP92_3176 [Caulobacter sp.]|nr:hypothetical protein [Caulobacter sp.]